MGKKEKNTWSQSNNSIGSFKKVTKYNQENEKLVIKHQMVFTQIPNGNSERLTMVVIVASSCFVFVFNYFERRKAAKIVHRIPTYPHLAFSKVNTFHSSSIITNL